MMKDTVRNEAIRKQKELLLASLLSEKRVKFFSFTLA